MIGWKQGIAETLSANETSNIALSAGTGKVTIKTDVDAFIGFSNISEDIETSDATKLPANTVMTIEVPTYKFKAVNKTIAGNDDSTYIYLMLESASDGTVTYVEH